MPPGISVKPLLLLAALSLFWGLNWPGMKILLAEVPVWWFRSICLIAGGGILLGVSALSGNRWRLRAGEFRPVAICGAFSILGWMVFSAYGVSLMAAGRASIIAFTMPLWATLFAAWVLGERITAVKVTGLLLGLAGLGLLIGADLLALQRAPIGAIFMLLAALSWAVGTVLIKKTPWQLPPLTIVSWQLLFSAVPVTLVAVFDAPFPDLGALSLPAGIAMFYLLAFPMTFCQWAYFKSVALLPASIAAIGTLMVPVVGVYSSHLVLGEVVGWNELLALGLVLSALVLVLLIPAWQHSSRQRRARPA